MACRPPGYQDQAAIDYYSQSLVVEAFATIEQVDESCHNQEEKIEQDDQPKKPGYEKGIGGIQAGHYIYQGIEQGNEYKENIEEHVPGYTDGLNAV